MVEENKAAGGEPPKAEDVQAALGRVKELEGELETARGKAKKFSDEAAAARVARKEEYENKIAELEQRLAGKSKEGDGSPTSKPNDAEAAQLRSELATLKKKDEERDKREAERDQRDKDLSHRNALSTLVARHKIESPDDAVELLMRRTKLAEDRKTLLFSAKDKDTGALSDLALTDDNFETSSLLGSPFWPAKGVPGAGGKGPKEVQTETGVDLSRVGDRDYWKKNKEKVTAALKQQKA